MADTFILSDLQESPAFSQEMSVAAVTGHPYLSHTAPMALMNPNGSGKIVRVKQIKIDPGMVQTSGGPFAYEISRTTAHSASTDTIAASSMDSSNAALPAQVVMCRAALSVTATGTPIGYVFADRITTGMTVALRSVAALTPWAKKMGKCDAPTAEMQRIILRENEGLTLRQPSNAAYALTRYLATVDVRVAATGACHRYEFPITNLGYPLWSLFNGSGSGVTLEVVSIGWMEIGTDEMPNIVVEPIDGLNSATGDALTPTPFDSTASIGSVFARRNAGYLMKGAKTGALISVPHHTWKLPLLIGIGPNFANVAGVMGRYNPVAPIGSELDIVLREGDGMAVTHKNASAFGRNRYSFVFTVESSSGAPPSGGGVSRGRVCNA